MIIFEPLNNKLYSFYNMKYANKEFEIYPLLFKYTILNKCIIDALYFNLIIDYYTQLL